MADGAISPNAPAQRVWFEDPEVITNDYPMDGQNLQARMRAKFQLYSYRVDNNQGTPREKFLLVALDGSTVQPGPMLYDRPDKRGHYTESVLLTMRFLDAPELVIRQDQPQATEQD